MTRGATRDDEMMIQLWAIRDEEERDGKEPNV
jgi:hypothetical protein